MEIGNLLIGAPPHVVVDPRALGFVVDFALKIHGIVIVNQSIVVVIRVHDSGQGKLACVLQAGIGERLVNCRAAASRRLGAQPWGC
jgi:hypothetical protein